MGTSTAVRSDRIDIRTNSEVKALIERAAELSHKSISAYIIESALYQAQQDIRETERLQLSVNERQSFYEALSNPPDPNDAMKNLFSDSAKG